MATGATRLVGASMQTPQPPAPGDRLIAGVPPLPDAAALGAYATPGGRAWVTQVLILAPGQLTPLVGYDSGRVAVMVFNVAGDTVYIGEDGIIGAAAIAGGGSGPPGFPVSMGTQFGGAWHEAPAALWAISGTGSTVIVAQLARLI